jgi:hypothetical protein
MSQLPNNSNLFIAQTPEPTAYGQTYHKQNYETDGITNYLNVNNDNSGNYTGSLGGFNFATLNSTMTDVLPLCNISPNGLTIPDISSSNKAILSQNGLTLNSGTVNTNEILPTQITLNDTVNNLTNLITPQIVELTDNQGTSSNIQCDAMGFSINDGTIYKTATFSSQSLQIKNWLTNNKILMTDNSITLNDYYNINTIIINKRFIII